MFQEDIIPVSNCHDYQTFNNCTSGPYLLPLSTQFYSDGFNVLLQVQGNRHTMSQQFFWADSFKITPSGDMRSHKWLSVWRKKKSTRSLVACCGYQGSYSLTWIMYLLFYNRTWYYMSLLPFPLCQKQNCLHRHYFTTPHTPILKVKNIFPGFGAQIEPKADQWETEPK